MKEVFNYWWLVFSVSFTLISQSIRSMRFQSMIKALGYEISFLRTFNAISVNYLVNIDIPRAGEFVRSGVLASYNGIPIQKSFGAVLNERFVDVLLLLLVGGLTFIFQYEIFVKFYEVYMASNIHSLLTWCKEHLFIAILILLLILSALAYGFYLLFHSGKSENKFMSKFDFCLDTVTSRMTW